MKFCSVNLFKFLAASALIFATPAFAQSKAKVESGKPPSVKKESKPKPKVAVSQKKRLSDAEKEELKAAQTVLKVMKTYHKGKFTRLFNNGTKAELMALPDLGEKTADRIIAARPHESSAHVVLVKGIGVDTYKKWVDARK